MQLPEQIETERIILIHPTQPTFQLAHDLYTVIDNSRETLREWLPWPDKTNSPEDEFNGFLMKWYKKHWDEQDGFAYLIYPKDKNRFAGVIDLMHVSEENKSAEIGYWLGNHAVGHGYMQEAVRALESVAFQAGINRIIIRNDTQNLRSVHVAKHCGYILEGVMHQDAWDEYHQRLRDTNIWAKLKSEWGKERK